MPVKKNQRKVIERKKLFFKDWEAMTTKEKQEET